MTPVTYWHRQELEKPLFPELEWSRPENKQMAGKLAVIGGNLHGFAAPAEAYAMAEQTGIGITRALLPDAVKSLVKTLMPEIEYAASTPSGSFSQQALGAWLDLAHWSDGVLLAGDLGRNSETAIVFENFVAKYPGFLVITKDAGNYALAIPQAILNRPDTTLVITTAQLQKLAIGARSTIAITVGMDLIRLVEALHLLTAAHPINIVTKFHETMCVASGGQVSTTKLQQDTPIWRVKTAAAATTWLLQNPTKPFEALTTAVAQ
jgi:ADP-dependent NAD(P)H-hydrate dehydratase / NAD(P)H-hydrate epimerase